MEDLTNVLMKFEYPRNHQRKNILKDGDKSYYGFVLGLVNSWAHSNVKETGADKRICRRTFYKKYQKIYELAKELAKNNDVEYTSIQFNKNYQCKKHIDGRNIGESTIIGLGNYTGGELLVYYDGPDEPPTKIDIKGKFFKFNGSEYYHETAEFQGERHTIVFYSI